MSVILIWAAPAFADVAFTDPSTLCMSERNNLTNAVNALTPTTFSGQTCKVSYVNALNCCNGYGDGCSVTTASVVGSGGLNGAVSGNSQMNNSIGSGLSANATICETHFRSANCTATTQVEANYQKRVYDNYQALNTCLTSGAAALTTASVHSGQDDVTSQGIQNALHQGADNSANTGAEGTQQVSMNLVQKTATVLLVGSSFLTGNPQGVKTVSPTLNPQVTTISGSGPNPNPSGD